MTADGAQGIASGLVQRGRKQTNDVLSDLEQLLDRGRDEVDDARRRPQGAPTPPTRASR